MNKVILTGNLVKNIELKYTESNKAVLQNTIAAKNDFRNANGEYESQFINIEVWNKTAEFLSKYAGKGSKVLVEGKIVTRNYTAQDGTKRYVTNVVVEKVELLDTKKQDTTPKETKVQEQQRVLNEVVNDPFEEYAKNNPIDDSDLPF